MRAHTLSVLFAAALFATAAQAQQFQPGQDVIVNPPPPGNTRILLYPGGKYMRVVHPLREPGAASGPIHLHMPRHHLAHVTRHKVRVAATAETATPPPPPRPAKIEKPAPATSVGDDLEITPAAPDTQLSATQAQPAKPVKAAPPPRRIAKVAPPSPASSAPPASQAGHTTHSMILFAPAAADPAPNALGAIKFLAGDLNAALTSESSRIQIMAYGGARGDKGTEARRLSLKRALSIRQILIDDGVSADRIDVRAMGGVDDGGPADRVDIYVKA